MVNLDPHNPIPLYHQTYQYLVDLMKKGTFKPGDMLPPETELAKILKVGRQTIRQAMAQLVDDGWIERFSGRGTFVCERKTRNDFFLDRSFSQEMEELGKKATAKVLKKVIGRIEPSSPKCFLNRLNSPCLYLTRLRYGDQEPIGLQEAVILTERCPGLENHDFTHESLFRVLTETYGLEIAEIYHVVNAVMATKSIADLLEIKTGSPILLEKSITYLSDKTPIEATTSHFRADKYEYSVRFRYMGSK